MNQKELVKSISRSFSLSLLMLPRPQRESVALTYCLARYADTLTDCGSWSSDERLVHLESWENAILKKDSKVWKLKGSLGSFDSKDSALLVEGDLLLAAYFNLSKPHQEWGDEVLKTLFQGMKWDLKTFADASSARPVFGCRDAASFDWYCYLIAGCVGRYWVHIFNLPQNLDLLSVAYGKGLQRINILRDVKEDWSRGRIYLPKESCDFEDSPPWLSSRWTDFIRAYILETKQLLLSGVHFCEALPKTCFRLRFASMMPVMIGLETLALIARRGFDGAPAKISRKKVRSLAIQAGMNLIFPGRLERWSRRFYR
jgi:farnesyl-diphosphate farnesyltransferase